MKKNRTVQILKKFTLFFYLLTGIIGFNNSLESRVLFTPIPEDRRIDLGGTWKFDPKAPERFYKSSARQLKSWKDIHVPACWVMQGFHVDTNHFAGYYRTFELPEGWSGKRIKLRNEAAYSVVKVYVNQQYVGSHEGGMTPYEFDITPYVKSGVNHLAIAVKAQSMADTLGCVLQYMNYPMGGIIRDIYLFAVPLVNISSVHVQTNFDKDFRAASLKLCLKLSNQSREDSKNLRIRCTLLDHKRNGVSSDSLETKSLPKDGTYEINHSILVSSPIQWNPENPYLYTLKIELMEAGLIKETVFQRIGFREIQVVGNRVFVNGRPIKLRGVNRHETHPLMGRSLTREIRLRDAVLFKAANVNYIRTSHYPPSDEFISICDSMGFFVELEAPFCWVSHGAGAASSTMNFKDPRFLKWLRNTTMETVERYRNHPSILIWSMANESFWSENWNKIKQLYDSLDMSRPKTFHDQAYGDYNNFGSTCMEIANIHYPGPKGPEVAQDFERPLLFGEYCHLNVYNRQEVYTDPQVRDDWGEILEKMWEDMYSSKGCLGGAIWSGIDDIFLLPDSTVTGYGPWGPVDGWRRTKPEYWHVKNVYSPIKVFSKTANYDPLTNEIKLQVDNRNIFTDLNQIKIAWTVGNESGNVIKELPPLSSGWISIRPRSSNLSGKKLKVSFVSPSGFSIIEYELPIGKADQVSFIPPGESKERYTIEESDREIVITGRKYAFSIDRTTGMISRVKSGNITSLRGGPALMVLPLKSNECAPKFIKTTEPLNSPLNAWKMTKIETGFRQDTLVVRVSGKYDEAAGSYEYIFNAEGEFIIIYDFEMNNPVNPRQFGMRFQVDSLFRKFSWKRNAQWSVYPEDHIGRPEGTSYFIKQSRYNDLWHPETNWKDDANELGSNDFRSTRKNIFWTRLENDRGNGIQVISDGKQSLRVFKDEAGFGMLVADFHTGGGEMFIGGEYEAFRKPLKKGSRIKGSVRMLVY